MLIALHIRCDVADEISFILTSQIIVHNVSLTLIVNICYIFHPLVGIYRYLHLGLLKLSLLTYQIGELSLGAFPISELGSELIQLLSVFFPLDEIHQHVGLCIYPNEI